jgi:hypothetical protein
MFNLRECDACCVSSYWDCIGILTLYWHTDIIYKICMGVIEKD